MFAFTKSWVKRSVAEYGTTFRRHPGGVGISGSAASLQRAKLSQRHAVETRIAIDVRLEIRVDFDVRNIQLHLGIGIHAIVVERMSVVVVVMNDRSGQTWHLFRFLVYFLLMLGRRFSRPRLHRYLLLGVGFVILFGNRFFYYL